MRLNSFHLFVTASVSLSLHAGVGFISFLGMGDIQPQEEIKLRIVKIEEIAEKVAAPQKLKSPKQKLDRVQKQKPKERIKSVEKKLAPKPQPAQQQAPARPGSPDVNAQILDQKLQASYEKVIVALLEKHKRYPKQALRRKTQGIATLRLSIAQSGQVLQSKLASSSGSEVLDAEVLRMVERASPFPKMPERLRMAQVKYLIPISFVLR